MLYFDAHCHLMEDTVFLNAQKCGVSAFIVNTTHPDEWEQVADLNRRITGIYFCAGVHPWFVNELPTDWELRLSAFLEKYPTAMIGEIGLDRTRPFFDTQRRVFDSCLKLAEKYNRRVHIHCVKAWDDLIEILIQYRGISPLFHRFSGDEFIIQKLKIFNPYFSILNGRYASIIPDNRLLVETDSPDGLKTPSAIPNLVRDLKLDINYLNQTFWEFLHD
ncbi:MAG: TatD family hydrolase [Pseudomonadota bacterium]|nr:TatD family hydrolase [Pseudomonadota bacterium]